MIEAFGKWYKTKSGLLVLGLAELALAYGFVSLAIDRGSLWYYLVSLIFLVVALQTIFKLIGNLFNGIHKSNKA